MSEGSITYQDSGELCGIFTVINSELRNHLVCNDGLACMEQRVDLESDSTIKKCATVLLPPGTRCNPLYNSCYGGIGCMKNAFEEYTCGGTDEEWHGNDEAINTSMIVTSTYEPNIMMVILGIILFILVIILYLYIFLYREWIMKKREPKYDKVSLVTKTPKYDSSIY